MPIGIIINCISVLLGGLFGTVLGKRLPERIKETLPNIFAISAAALGITLIANVNNLSAVILSLIVGTVIGEGVTVDEKIRKVIGMIENHLPSSLTDTQEDDVLMTLIMLFCFSATGTFGAMVEGFTGEYDVLLTKSVLDFFTAAIFAATIGIKVSLISIPQFAIYYLLFLLANIIMPVINSNMISDFRACGGIINLAVAINLLKLKNFKLLNIVPALLLVMFFSYIFSMF